MRSAVKQSRLTHLRNQNDSETNSENHNKTDTAGSPATTGDTMTETHELDTITEALTIIDQALGEMLHRELVSTNEVSDLLLDVRSILSHDAGLLVKN